MSLYEKMRLDEKEYSISEYFKDLCSNSIIMLDIVTVYINSLKNAQHQKVIGMLQILKGSLAISTAASTFMDIGAKLGLEYFK